MVSAPLPGYSEVAWHQAWPIPAESPRSHRNQRKTPQAPGKTVKTHLHITLAVLPALMAGCAGLERVDLTRVEFALGVGVGAALAGLALALGTLWLRRLNLRARLRRELEHLLHWTGQEGVFHKAGILRRLSAMGGQPVQLDGAWLAGAELPEVRLERARMRGTRLDGANLRGANLRHADLFGAELHDADLAMADLRGANLRGADLRGAVLAKARLEGANLHRAILIDADLSGVDLRQARITAARFSNDDPGPLYRVLHPSVEDWIREALDEQGRYVGDSHDDAGTDDLPLFANKAGGAD